MIPYLLFVRFSLSRRSRNSLSLQLETRGPTSHVHEDDQPTHGKSLEFWNTADIFRTQIITKLDSVSRSDLVGRMRACGQSQTALTCRSCGSCRVVFDRCERRWCPRCSARLSRERVEELQHWTATLKQPKHVVLTARNTATLTRSRVRDFLKAIARIRRTKFAKKFTPHWCSIQPRRVHGSYPWTCGTWCLEVTNESRGWHLHAHLLVESRYIDAVELSFQWAKQIGQDFAIVKVKDAREKDYLAEVTKYVVKSADLAKWEAEEIAEFVVAFKGRRAFGVFGTLVGQRAEYEQIIRSVRDKFNGCKCGCREFTVEPAYEGSRMRDLIPNHEWIVPGEPQRKCSAVRKSRAGCAVLV